MRGEMSVFDRFFRRYRSWVFCHRPDLRRARDLQAPSVSDQMARASQSQVELTNLSEKTLKSIEILTIFLKDKEAPGGGPSQAHIRFERVKSMQPGEKTVLSHRTWMNGKPADADHDQVERLKLIAGQANTYALEISWEEPDGKMRFQRIPVGN